MNEYLRWKKSTITDFSYENINAMYNRGFIFGRPYDGFMQQTRSIRVDISKLKFSSENRRILRKTEGLTITSSSLPFSNYSWKIGKMGKDFYKTKFGDKTFSANKIKELFAGNRNDFNKVLVYNHKKLIMENQSNLGYCIAVETDKILHYSYPFYNLHSKINNLGMGMMINAIKHAKKTGKQYLYLGSFQRPADIYKLQFSGTEWFDGKRWNSDLDKLKKTV